MTLGQRIRKARKDAGFNNPESFAVHLGVSAATVGRWERDEHAPTIRTVTRIAQETGKPLEFFFVENVAA